MLMFVFALMAIAAAALYARRRRTAIAALLLGGALLGFGGSALVSGYLVRSLQDQFPAEGPSTWGDKNLIVLLGQGTERAGDNLEVGEFSLGRLLKAFELYSTCRGKDADGHCTILICGGDPQAHGEPEADVYARRLGELGVPATNLIRERTSLNTWENARNSSKVIAESKADLVVLVSSGTHLERSVLYFQHFGVEVRPVRADYLSPIDEWLPNEFNLLLSGVAIREYTGIARYHLYQAFGLNRG